MGDYELDRLSTEMDAAWRRKQDALAARDRAWQRRCDAREPMRRAAEARDKANEVQQDSWRDLCSLRDRHGPRIEDLNRRQETAYQNMRSAFDRASASYEAHDGNAGRYSQEGHNYKAESQSYVAERRRLVDELVEAQARHEDVQAKFQRANDKFKAARRPFDDAKAEHERLEAEWQSRKKEFFAARDAFMRRLREVRGARARRNEDDHALAERAGVPSMYLDDLMVRRQGDVINIYFGGVGAPNGEGHGHYAMLTNGHVKYRRDPHTQHGGHNFTEQQGRPRKSGWSGRADDLSDLFEDETPAAQQPPQQPSRPVWSGADDDLTDLDDMSDTSWEKQRSDGKFNVFFNRGSQDGAAHGHVVEERHEDGSRTYTYVRDREGNVYVDDSKD